MTFIIILTIIICIALVFIVLIQNPKGGGLMSEFSSANQIIGVQKSTDTIEKITWGLAFGLLFLCLSSTYVGTHQEKAGSVKESLIKDKVIELPSTPPTMPINQPSPENNGGGQVPPTQETPIK